MDSVDPIPPPPRPCSLCGKPAVEKYKPFCSKRCAEIDLGRWLKGIYRVETDEPVDDEQRPIDEA
jgi:endogenous inhibitor of DNA gyrase (YacG/DUF329 family)